MSEQGMRFRIGLFVLMGLALLATLVTLFGSFPSFFRRHNEYTVLFNDAPGIGAGTPVRRSGVRIGEVKSVDLDNDTGEVRVRLLVEQKYLLHHNEQPTLVQGLIGSDASVDVMPVLSGAAADRSTVAPGEVLTGVRQASVNTLLSRASEVVPNTQETIDQMRKSLHRFEQMVPLMEETVREYRDLARATREAVPELRRTNEEVRGLAKAARETMPNVGSTSDEVRELAKAVRETVPDLRRTNEQIASAAENWGRVGNHVDTLLDANQDKLVRTVDTLNETLSRLGATFNEDNQRNLSAVLKNVKTSSDNLESITRNTDDLLKESRQTIHKVGESVVRADDALGNLQQATKPLAERSSNIIKNLDESTEKLNTTLGDLRDLLKLVTQSNGSFQKMITDPSLYNHLDESAFSIVRLMPRLEHILQDLEVFADKIARHPESIGVSGVVRPSSGIK